MSNLYFAIGKEDPISTPESSTVGFIPIVDPVFPVPKFEDEDRKEARGEKAIEGQDTLIRMASSWSWSPKIRMFSESGTVAAIIGTMLRHFAGKMNEGENASTGQHYHMMYGTAQPFIAGNIGTEGLTVNTNHNQDTLTGTSNKNWPFAGGRITKWGFDQAYKEHLTCPVEWIGRVVGAETAEIGTPLYAAENLRFSSYGFKVYQGVTRVGAGSAFTDFTFGGATQIIPHSIKCNLENPYAETGRLSGLKYADQTDMAGEYKATFSITLNWRDPASGFSSVDEVLAWIASITYTDFFLFWDTGTQAGTGDNHSLGIDLPYMHRVGDMPDYSDLKKTPIVTLNYEARYSTTTAYRWGIMLKNTVENL